MCRPIFVALLETPSGVGLVGLLLAKKRPSCRVVLSDFSPHVIKKLEENVVTYLSFLV